MTDELILPPIASAVDMTDAGRCGALKQYFRELSALDRARADAAFLAKLRERTARKESNK